MYRVHIRVRDDHSIPFSIHTDFLLSTSPHYKIILDKLFNARKFFFNWIRMANTHLYIHYCSTTLLYKGWLVFIY